MLLILYCPCCSQVDVICGLVFCIPGAARTCPAWKVQNSVLHVDWLWEPAQEISRVKPTQATCARCTYVVLLLSHHTVVMAGYLVYCVFVCTVNGFFSGEKRYRNFACVFDYYPDGSSLILVNFGSRGVTSRMSYIQIAMGQSELGTVGQW